MRIFLRKHFPVCWLGSPVFGLNTDYAFSLLQKVPVVKEEDEPEEEDEEEMGHAETYAEYMPIKCMSLGLVNIVKDFWVPLK